MSSTGHACEVCTKSEPITDWYTGRWSSICFYFCGGECADIYMKKSHLAINLTVPGTHEDDMLQLVILGVTVQVGLRIRSGKKELLVSGTSDQQILGILQEIFKGVNCLKTFALSMQPSKRR